MTLKEFLKKVNGEESGIIDYDGKEALEAVKQDGDLLQYVKDQTSEICLEAVKRNGDSLQYVKEQTSEICLEAVKQNGYSLRYVKEQTSEICLEAVKRNELSLRYVNKSIFTKARIIVLDKKEIEISEESYQSFKKQFTN